MEETTERRRVFTLADARQLLPVVQQITADAVGRADVLADAIESLDDEAPERPVLGAELKEVIDKWVERIQELGLEAKGLWLVDFDNGDGYYCWRYPEESLSHYHDYAEGFAGRMKIM